MTIISTSALAAWIGIQDNDDDPNLGSAASAANRSVARFCGRTFETTSSSSASARTYRPKSWTMCHTDDFWTTSGLVVKVDQGDDGTYETTLTIGQDFYAEPLNGIEDGLAVPYRRLHGTSFVFPNTGRIIRATVRPSVQVTAAWGWASIPEDVTLAALIKGARLFKRRQSIEGFAGGFQDFAARISRSEDPDVVDLLSAYRTTEVQLLAV